MSQLAALIHTLGKIPPTFLRKRWTGPPSRWHGLVIKDPQGTARDHHLGVKVPVATAPPGYLTINEAARELDVSPWRVVELADAQHLASVRLIEADSLHKFRERTPLEVVKETP